MSWIGLGGLLGGLGAQQQNQGMANNQQAAQQQGNASLDLNAAWAQYHQAMNQQRAKPRVTMRPVAHEICVDGKDIFIWEE